jgi:disulfide bond formation protein DsbB
MSPVSSFLIAKFSLFGLEFQNWMAIAAVAVALFGLYHWLSTRD